MKKELFKVARMLRGRGELKLAKETLILVRAFKEKSVLQRFNMSQMDLARYRVKQYAHKIKQLDVKLKEAKKRSQAAKSRGAKAKAKAAEVFWKAKILAAKGIMKANQAQVKSGIEIH